MSVAVVMRSPRTCSGLAKSGVSRRKPVSVLSPALSPTSRCSSRARPKSRSFGAPFRRHEDVRGLQVPMHDEMAMGVGHGVADFEKQRDARARVESARGAVLEQVPAFDVLHREVRKAVGRRAAVEQPGDVRVVEPGEDLPLCPKAPQDEIRVHAAADELHGRPSLELLIRAHAQVHAAHPSVSELAHDRPWTDALRRRRFGPGCRTGAPARPPTSSRNSPAVSIETSSERTSRQSSSSAPHSRARMRSRSRTSASDARSKTSRTRFQRSGVMPDRARGRARPSRSGSRA